MKTAIVVGAGLSGLSCAIELENNGYQVQVLEKENHPGGSVQSDIIDGYILNRGFQVLQTGYPESKRLLDYNKLEPVSYTHLRAHETGSNDVSPLMI